MERMFHVYATDGFESAHRSEKSARAYAKRAAKRTKGEYRVVATSLYGLTGGGHGTTVARFTPSGEVQ